MKTWLHGFFGIGFGIVLISGVALAGGDTEPRKKRAEEPLTIKVANWGPVQKDVEAAKARVEKSAVVREALGGGKYRLVGFEYIEPETGDKNAPTPVPTHFRVMIYNYTAGQLLVAENDFAGQEAIRVREDFFEPGVGMEEISAAFDLVKADPEFAGWESRKQLEIDSAMPPVTTLNGTRLVNVIVRNLNSGETKIVGVNFKNDSVVRYENNAPPTAAAAPEACGISSAGQGSTGPGVAGQHQLTVTQNGNPLWEMLVVRPSSSSGANGERSGIEVRDVKYKGKSVLKRGHAPILNVQYDGNVCGPFRDWQYAEGFFQVPTAGTTYPNGTGGGIALVGAGGVATTAVETRNDTGNFQGVAIYEQNVGYGNELVMVTELNAGWYRYIMEWRFAPDGTIRPRYGFASTVNSCVCSPRNHHVYWRFDFDIVQANNKIFQVERGRKFMRPVTSELAIFRNYKLNRGFMIQNSNGNEAYQITPNLTDGSVTDDLGVLTDVYGGGGGTGADFWLLRFKGTGAAPTELDDPNSGSAANLASWVNGESMVDQDVVVWYAAHQRRIDDASLNPYNNTSNIIAGVHVVGPDIRPVRW